MKNLLLIFISISFLFSCSTSNEIVHLKKKKYVTGYSYMKAKKHKGNKRRSQKREDLTKYTPLFLANKFSDKTIQIENNLTASLPRVNSQNKLNEKAVFPISPIIRNNGGEVFTKKAIPKFNHLYGNSENVQYSNFDDDWLVTLLLLLFLGVLGVHRFYLGYIGLGILYLLTAGFCGIGVLVDLILFLTGNLNHK